jgi:formylmethanofuran dehydrogenase subunit B
VLAYPYHKRDASVPRVPRGNSSGIRSLKHFDNIACTVCGCVCDDLRVTVEGGHVVQTQGTCPLSERWFLTQGTRQPPAAEVDGRAVPLNEAVSRAAALLRAAKSPLIYGLSRSSTEGQRAAVALAERLGATLDTTASLCHGPSIMALQEVGEVTCTLGEVKNRADLIVYWGVNPALSHPRHMERYSLFAQGRFTPRGRADRILVVADVKPTATSELADIFLPIEPGNDFEVLTLLRLLVRGVSVSHLMHREIHIESLEDLAQRLKSCRYGVVFFGLGLSMTRVGQHNVEALLLLVRDLNQYTRFCARRMRIPGDVSGADLVLAWQTGYPFSVNFARGYPRYNPGEFSAQDMLEHGDIDACLFVGSEGAELFSKRALANLQQMPVITLDYPTVESAVAATVRFTTAAYGVHRPGTAYRMDNVPIRLRPFLAADYPSDDEVLSRIAGLL